MPRRILPSTLILLSLAGAAFGAWRYFRPAEQPVGYRTAAVERGTISRMVTATGTVNPVSTVQVGSYVSGPIQEIFADFNSPVKRGQRVAQIDPRPFSFKVKQAEATLATAKAQVEKDRADLDFKRRVLKRTRELFERNLIAKQEAEAAERDYDQGQAQLQLDQARVAQEAAAAEESRVNLGYTAIESPVDGVVVARNVDVGQTVAASFQTPVLFLIAQDLTKMQVNANVSESDIGLVAEQQRAFFTVDAYPGRQFEGVVAQVRNSPQTVQNVVTYNVMVNVENADLALKPGMTANISIVNAQREQVLKVPLAALRFRPPGKKSAHESTSVDHGTLTPSRDGTAPPEQRQVWIQIEARQLTPVAVRVGISDEQFAELVGGDLTEGARVVTAIDAAGQADASQPTLPGFGMRWRR
ncbi:MAG: efflux RND transporter periplasmic adaptor subunit [Deltaproteobacteria bacterium]|nr:efflux RND transporter periplasmic adaptor subunit [Deltaproteobacteria bacterium]